MQLYALPDGRHVAVGEHASIRELDAVQAHVGQFEHAVVLDRGEVDDHHAHVERELRDALKRIAALEAERARYIESTAHWGVRLSRGTFLEFHEDEQTARARAQTYHATLLRCDVLSTDWREVPADAEIGA